MLEKVSLSRLLFGVDVLIQVILGMHTSLGAPVLQVLLALPNSRTQELEADLVGLRLMSKACFDPQAVVKYVSLLSITRMYSTFSIDSGNRLNNQAGTNLHKSFRHIRVIKHEQKSVKTESHSPMTNILL